MVCSISKAASIRHRPIHSRIQITRNDQPIFFGLRSTVSHSFTITLVQRVSLSSVKPSMGRWFFPKESRIGVITNDVSRTKRTLIELMIPTQCIGRIGMTMNESRETSVVKPQKNTDHPISLIVSTMALRR